MKKKPKTQRYVECMRTIEIEWHFIYNLRAHHIIHVVSYEPKNFSKHISPGKIRFVASFASLPSINNEKILFTGPCVTLYTTLQSYILVYRESLFCLFMVILSGFNWNISNGVMRLRAYHLLGCLLESTLDCV